MKKILVGFAIVLLAFFFRSNNLNWDANFHLHPDERFLTMVGTAMKIPASFGQYLDQSTSLMNPANIGYKFFVYGHFPLIMTKYLAVIDGLDNYNDLTILGRQLSAFFDLLIVVLVIKTVLLLEKRYKFSPLLKYWAGFFYAISVLPIQLSHFFAVDTFLNFFMFGSFYFALRYSMMGGKTPPLRDMILSAIFFGLALSCKVTAVFILPLNLFFLIKTIFVRRQSLIKTTGFVLAYFALSYFTIRLADPYYFQNKNLFDPTLSKVFVENIKSLRNMTVKDLNNWFPPMVQWLNKNTAAHSLVNNIAFGLGIPYTIFVLIGALRVVLSFPRKRESIPVFIILLWVIGFFTYQSIQVTPALRYFIIIYPFLAIFAGIGINSIFKKNAPFHVIQTLTIVILLIWPLMFSSIYFNKNTRVEASEWIYKNLPNGSYILSESWDDSLPLSVIDNYGKQFTGEQLPVFDSDISEKWQKMENLLMRGDYYILSSNRGWGSIPTVPQKYPLMSKFYNELLADRNINYKKIKEFKPFYYKFFELPNSWVDEAFTVYDHPIVLIYKNVKKL